MEFFNKAKAVRLRSHLNKYLVADDDEETVRQSRVGSSRKARWVVELVQNKANVVRLKGCHGRYLTASDEAFLLGWTGKKVVQSISTSKMDSPTEWEAIKDGVHLKLRAKGGTFLRANGSTPPWRNSITHDVPQRTATQDWVLWSVDVVDIAEFESRANIISPASSFSSLPDDFAGSETGSPKVGSDTGSPAAPRGRSRVASNRQINVAQTEDENERSKSHMAKIDEDKASTRTIFTPSNPREKTFDAVSKTPIDPNERISKPQFDNADEANSIPQKPMDQTRDVNPPTKAPDVVPAPIPAAVSSPTVRTATSMSRQSSAQMEDHLNSVRTATSMSRQSSAQMEDHLNSVFSELESIVSDVGSCSSSFSMPRTEDHEALETSAVPSREEIRQALVALKECLRLEFSQLKQPKVRAKFILALSTLSIAKGSMSEEQMDAAHHFLTNFNAQMMKFDRAERQLAECNKFFCDKNRAYDDLKVINELNLDLKARIDELNEEEGELLRRIEEIRVKKTELVDKRMELGEESKSALAKWNDFRSLEPAAVSRLKKFEKRRDEIIEDWSNLKALFN